MISRHKAYVDRCQTQIETHVSSLVKGVVKHAPTLTPEKMQQRRELQAEREHKADTQESYK